MKGSGIICEFPFFFLPLFSALSNEMYRQIWTHIWTSDIVTQTRLFQQCGNEGIWQVCYTRVSSPCLTLFSAAPDKIEKQIWKHSRCGIFYQTWLSAAQWGNLILCVFLFFYQPLCSAARDWIYRQISKHSRRRILYQTWLDKAEMKERGIICVSFLCRSLLSSPWLDVKTILETLLTSSTVSDLTFSNGETKECCIICESFLYFVYHYFFAARGKIKRQIWKHS